MQTRPRERSRRERVRRSARLLLGVHPVREALRARRRALRPARAASGRSLAAARARRARRAGARGRDPRSRRCRPSASTARCPRVCRIRAWLLEAGPLPDARPRGAGREPSERDGWLVALDGIEDPQNLGAILRVAEAAGARGAILPERRVAPLSPAVARASAGALEHLPVAQVTNLVRALEKLEGARLLGPRGRPERRARSLRDSRSAARRAGSSWCSARRGGDCDRACARRSTSSCGSRWPGVVESLNVATAAAVVLFEWARRARARRGDGDAERA